MWKKPISKRYKLYDYNSVKFIKRKSYVHSKGNHKQNEKAEWEEVFANQISDKNISKNR